MRALLIQIGIELAYMAGNKTDGLRALLIQIGIELRSDHQRNHCSLRALLIQIGIEPVGRAHDFERGLRASFVLRWQVIQTYMFLFFARTESRPHFLYLSA